MTARETPRRSLRHRLPIRLRHHWKLLAVCTATGLTLSLTAGGAMVRACITSELTSQTVITQDIQGASDLFDGSSHTIEITYDEAEYQEVIDADKEDGEKKFLRADITIDGVLIEDVGLRLKGNSTLSSLRTSDGGDRGGMAGGMGMTQLSEDSPEELPWLISFDEYQEGRAFQSRTEMTLRPAASGSDTALNEALALELTALSGQTRQDYTYTSVRVNGREESARLLVDTPDELWADSLGEGVLYKARAGGSFEYVGEDPTDDEEFAEKIDEYVDVESFATYLATQALISNSDAMGGSGVLEERLREDEDFVAMYEQAYAELYDQLIASGEAQSVLDELTSRAESVGDEGAAELSATLSQQLGEISAEAPEQSTTMGGRPG